MIHHAMTFDVGFIHHVQTEFGAKLVPGRVVWIVTVAYTVQVELFHQLNIMYHGSDTDSAPFVWIVLVTVYSFKQYCFPVDHLHSVAHFYRAETKKVSERFKWFSLGVEGADY